VLPRFGSVWFFDCFGRTMNLPDGSLQANLVNPKLDLQFGSQGGPVPVQQHPNSGLNHIYLKKTNLHADSEVEAVVKMAHCLPPACIAKNKIVQVLLPVEKASFKCINMYKHLPKRSSTHCDVIPPPAVSNIKPTKARECASQLGHTLVHQKGFICVH